ncbi:MAG: hypothetical protein V1917_02240 [Candidatus Gottesmanbacteria bacterium]
MNIQNNKWIGVALLVGTVVFNLWLYRNEPTATIDPNDNAFQYALIDRTNTIWDYANRTCPHNLSFVICHMSLLADHWVPNWAEGYNLPYYYSHVPQMLIVGSYRLLHLPISLFQYYHYIIYFFLSLFPLSLFLASRVLKFPWLTAGIAAILASQISTDGLYGIDQTSFLWRGWGLSSQLFALMWLPLTIAYAIRYITNEKKQTRNIPLSLVFTVFFLVLTTTGHLGIGMMAFMVIGVICFTPVIIKLLTQQPIKHVLQTAFSGIKQTACITLPAFFLLSYWIVPAFINNDFHNISVWDPVWKFNSFGAVEVVTKLVNGELFDFGRLPVFTLLVLIGLFASIKTVFPFLFLFFLLLFFGKTTWGNLLNIIPGMSEFHGHRFIVGLHLTGLFLAPLGLTWIMDGIGKLGKKTPTQTFITQCVILCVLIVSCGLLLLPRTIEYATYNDTLIKEANTAYKKIQPDVDLLFSTLTNLQKERPGRVYALRGNEGKDFRIASTAYYMHLSTYGISTVLWLPETWSLNSDTEQFFSEDNETHYALYNIAYIVAPPTKKPQSFWKLLKETEQWKLYIVETEGYMSLGTAPSIITSKKTDIINLIHLWIQSTYPKQSIYPELRLTNDNVRGASLPNFAMINEATYKTPDEKIHNLFAEPPVYESQTPSPLPMRILSQTTNTDMEFHIRVEITEKCNTCIVLLKQTYHPNWRVTVNGKREKLINIFPSYNAVRIEAPGIYDIVFSYTPSSEKQFLFFGGVIIFLFFAIYRTLYSLDK